MIHFWRNPGYGVWKILRYRPWNIAWCATARYAWALFRPTLPGNRVRGRACTPYEAEHFRDPPDYDTGRGKATPPAG